MSTPKSHVYFALASQMPDSTINAPLTIPQNKAIDVRKMSDGATFSFADAWNFTAIVPGVKYRLWTDDTDMEAGLVLTTNQKKQAIY